MVLYKAHPGASEDRVLLTFSGFLRISSEVLRKHAAKTETEKEVKDTLQTVVCSQVWFLHPPPTLRIDSRQPTEKGSPKK